MKKKSNTISAVNLALFIAEKTDKNLFLTGKAGTGKTVFLKEFKEHTKKKTVVLAPTGIAAINAGAMTIHSFFEFSFSPYVPKAFNANIENEVLSYTDSDKLIKELDIIIIDEISMVRADLLDLIDYKLRKVRCCQEPFGGVQLLLIGDLYQLPPVVNPYDRNILKDHYSSNYYFFNSDALKKAGFLTVCLDKVYRQSDEHFVKILSKARLGKLSWPDINKLNTRFDPQFETSDEENCITLVSRKSQADTINSTKLDSVQGESKTFSATITGDFPKDMYPTHLTLSLKVGAHVMFLRNNILDGVRNGTLGQITGFKDDGIVVKVEDRTVTVYRTFWENISYRYIDEENEIREEVKGKFSQFPLKPAWAITVHKSQGLTFDKVVIDLPHTFESGQAYVAFSRCRTLEGIVLKRKVNPNTFFVDPKIEHFYNSISTDLNLLAEKVSYVPFECPDDAPDETPPAMIDTALANTLKEWRLNESRSKRLAAFQVLTNRSLNEIATRKPKNMEELASVYGVGLSTISKYAEDILRIVKESINEGKVGLEAGETANENNSTDKPSTKMQKQKSWEISYEMYMSGKSIEEIAAERGITPSTVAAHLMKYIDSGDINPHDFVDDEIIESVRQFKIEHPESEKLKDIYDALNETVSYEQIRFALKCLD